MYFRPIICTCIASAVTLASSMTAQTLRQNAAAEKQKNAPQVEIANVLFRYSPSLSILIVRLRGSLLPTEGHDVTSFNEPDSFVIGTDAAEIRMTTDQLTGLINSWLLSSPKAQLKHVQISTSGNQLMIRGIMKKGVHIPFEASADVSVTNDNRIRIAVRDVKAAHIPVKGAMDALGLDMDDLISQKGLKGMSVDKDSFLIDPQSAFPAPQIRARVTAARVSGQSIVITFGKGAPPPTNEPAKNYIALRGGNVMYGREEMFNADMIMTDSTPADAFEFYLAKYWCQMVAGDIKVTPDQALRVSVVDFSKLRKGSCRE